MAFAIITENDESQWSDETGVRYHFPSRYKNILVPGTQVIYYRGKLRDLRYRAERKDDSPHYFGCGTIEAVIIDTKSKKNDLYAEISHYSEFDSPVMFKNGGRYLEAIPQNRENNYFRDGVRAISADVYREILLQAGYKDGDRVTDGDLESYFEGNKTIIYTTRYERSPRLRRKVIELKGTTCSCCGFDFFRFYGAIGKGYIQIHHTKPLHNLEEQSLNSVDDLVPICPNCHAMIHREKIKTLSIEELKSIVKSSK